MAVIDVGPGATDRLSSSAVSSTRIDLANPANDTGSLDTIELWFLITGAGVKCGTFSGSSTKYTSRDYEAIGDVTSGSKQSFSGLDCDVEAGDYLGVCGTSGNIDGYVTGGSGVYYKAGDQFGAGEQTYVLSANYVISLYATGTTGTAQPPMQNAIPAVMALLMN